MTELLLGLDTVLDNAVLVLDIITGSSSVEGSHGLLGLVVGTVSGVVEMRFGDPPDSQDEDAGEDELGGNQGLPLGRLVDGDELAGHSADELANTEAELVSTDHETTDLEGSKLRDVGDENGLGQANTETDEDGSAEPSPPVGSADFSNGASEKDEDGSHHGGLAANSVCEVTTCEHAEGLGHFGETLEVGDDFGAESRSTVDRGIGHSGNKGG